MTPEEFFDAFGETAREICKQYSLPASVCLSQMAQESGWAAKMPPNSNNPFGIKWHETEGGAFVWYWSKEYLPNQDWEDIPAADQVRWTKLGEGWWEENSQFRVFDCLGDAFVPYCRRVIESGYYIPALERLPDDVEGYCRNLCRTWATRATYGDEVWNRILKYDLRRFDTDGANTDQA